MLYTISHIQVIRNRQFDASQWGGSKTADGGRRIQYTLIDEEGEEDGIVVDQNEAFVRRFTQYYSDAEQDGTDGFGRPKYKDSLLKDEKNPAPEKLFQVRGHWQFVRFPGNEPYVPITVGEDGAARIVYKKGHKPDGTRLFSTSLGVSIFVRCRKEINEEGREVETPRKGYEPESLMQSFVGSSFLPLSEAQSLMGKPTKPKVGVDQTIPNAPLPPADDDDQI